MPSPLIIMVGADKGGVGKTQVSRALRDYFDSPPLAALPKPEMYDGQYPRGDLVQFCPSAHIVNLTDIADQMKVFGDFEGVRIIDIPAGVLGFALRSCDEAMLLDDVRSGKLRMALLHVLGPSVSSMDEIADATALLGTAASHFIVKNRINETNFFEWDQNSAYSRSLQALAGVTIDVPHLDTTTNESIQQAKCSFVEFCASSRNRVLRGRAGKWLERTCSGFDRVGIGRMIEETYR
jgi:hypothetical protein